MSKSGERNPAIPTGSGNVRRGRPAHVEWVAERLSDRDWLIIESVNRLRLMSGSQLERLCFATLAGHTRSVVRGRVLRRLVNWQALTVLPRRVGGAARGSAGASYALGRAGARLCAERQATAMAQQRVRHPGAPTARSMQHTQAVSELYVGVVEQARAQGVQVVAFEAEPTSWWPNGLGGFIKPDAYVCLMSGYVREHWWVEVDLATESLPTVKRKLLTYLHFVARGQLGPGNLVPRIILSCSMSTRRAALRGAVLNLPVPAADLFVVLSNFDVASYVLQSLKEE